MYLPPWHKEVASKVAKVACQMWARHGCASTLFLKEWTNPEQ